jgi:Tol biopolymer transport system component
MSLPAGTLVSHYRIVALLGRGGMGEVYHAVDTRLDRPVALKTLSEQLIRADGAIGRFEQEAHAASSLNHPNIVTVFDVGRVELNVEGQSRAIHFIAMELVEGETLRALVKRGALSVRQRVDILSQVAAGLAKAHAAGIIHRDLKPDNIMVTSDGYAKVLDFGLAKLTEKQRLPDGSTSRQLTQFGAVLGTAGYMSPEQVEQRAVDYRTDIFSFGCVAHYALAGSGPFDRDSIIDTLHAIVHSDPPDLREVAPDTPPVVAGIVAGCLAKALADRPQSSREVATALMEIARTTDPSSLPALVFARRRRFLPLAILAAVVVTLVSVIALALRKQAADTPFEQMRITRAVASGRSTVAAISPDGNYLAYSVDEGGRQSLSIRQLASGTDITVASLADVHFVGAAFSPDGNYLYYVSADNRTDHAAVYQIPVIGGVARQVIDDLHARIAISPDGTDVLYVRTDRAGGRSLVGVRAISGGAERVVTERKLPDTFNAATWSPDGEKIAYAYVTYGGGYHAVIGTMNTAGGGEEVLESPRWRIVDSLIWMPAKEELIVNAKDRTDSRNQLWILGRGGKTRRITNDLSDYEAASLTADGQRLVTLQRNSAATIWRGSRQLGRASENLDGMHGLAVLADGRIVFTVSTNDRRDLWIMDAGGGNRRRLTDGGSDILPAASPDAKSVAFMSMRSGQSNIWKLDVETGAVNRLTTGDFDSSPAIAPDGTWFAFHSNRSGPRTIWRESLLGGGARQVTTTASSWPAISPDGTLIACSWFDPATNLIGIAVVPAEGGERRQFFNIPVNAWMGGNNHHTRWTRQGITYVSNDNGVSNIWVQPLDGRPPRLLTRFSDGQIFYFDWAADGHLVYSRGSVTSNVVMIEGFR